jgi:hypothetical protein
MKNVTKLAVGILLAAVVGLSSCVKNEVSPEVTALRKGQVANLDANTQLTLAQTKFELAEAALKEAEVAFKVADDAFNLKKNEATMNTWIATQAALTMQQQATLEAYRLTYEANVAAYEKFIAEGNFANNMRDWLSNYQIGSGMLNGMYHQRIDLQQDIAQAQLLVIASDGPTNGLKWDVVKARLEDMVTSDSAYLKALYAARTSLESVLADPTTLIAEAAALGQEVWDLENRNAALGTDVANAKKAYDAVGLELDDANLAIGLMDTRDYLDYRGTYSGGFLKDSLAIIDDSLGFIADIEAATAALVPLNAHLTSATAALATAQTAYNAKLAAYNTAKTNNDNQQNLIDKLTSDLAVANNNLNAAASAIPYVLANYNAALAIRDAIDNGTTGTLPTAIAARDGATGTLAKLAQAEQDLGEAGIPAASPERTAALALSNADGVVTDIQDDIETENQKITTANAGLADVEFDLALVRAKIAEWRPKYDAAKLALPGLELQYAKLEHEWRAIQLKVDANDAMITSLQGVIYTYQTHVEGIAEAIADNKKIIEGVEDDITGLNTQIANNVIDKAWAEGNIANLQAELAALEIAIAEKETIVASWKKLMDDAIAAQG